MEGSIYSFPAYQHCRFCHGGGCVLCHSERKFEDAGIVPKAKPGVMECLPEFLYRKDLFKRGWRDGLIISLLGKPDKKKRNMYGVECRLWLRTRVEAAEATEAFQVAFKDRERSRARAKKATQTKRERIEAEIRALEIKVPEIEPADLIKFAVHNRNSRISDREWEEGEAQLAKAEDVPLWPEIDPFRDRICVNFLRHKTTKYDAVLRRLAGRVGKDKAKWILRERIYQAISEAYPMLAVECTRQLEERRNSE